MDCIFCRIVAGEVPSDVVYQDERVIAFRDIHPVASTHILIIPKKHITSVTQLSDGDLPLVGHMVGVAKRLAIKEGVSESGYRLIINNGEQGGQLVPHLHMHLIGGRRLADSLG